MSRESEVRSVTSTSPRVASNTATAVEASITSDVPVLPHSWPEVRAMDPSSVTSSHRFRDRDKRACRLASLQAWPITPGGYLDSFAAVERGLDHRQDVAVTAIHLDQGPGIENEGHGP